MRVLVCGSRDWRNYDLILEHVGMLKHVDVIIEGGAPGADSLARKVARKLYIPYLEFTAAWRKDGKRAGPMRNQRMLDEGKPDLVLAFHNHMEHSKGTKDMVDRAEKADVEVRIVEES